MLARNCDQIFLHKVGLLLCWLRARVPARRRGETTKWLSRWRFVSRSRLSAYLYAGVGTELCSFRSYLTAILALRLYILAFILPIWQKAMHKKGGEVQMDSGKMNVNATLQGVRDASYDKKQTDGSTERVPRFVADLYIRGMGAVEMTVDQQTAVNLDKLAPGTAVLLPVQLENRNVVVNTGTGRPYARRELGVRLGALELAEQGKKAS